MSRERIARWLVRERAGGWCEVRLPDVCQGRAANWHHRTNRSAGGRWAASNGLHLCGSGTTGCHGWITEHPEESVRHGWSVPSWADPARTPVLIHTLNYQHAVVLLDDEGCYSLAPFPAGDERHPDDIPVVLAGQRARRGAA